MVLDRLCIDYGCPKDKYAFQLDTIAGCNKAMASGTLVLHSYQNRMASLGIMRHEFPTTFALAKG
jgi:hypothetical protein